MPTYEVILVVEADNPANAILPILYPNGVPTRMKIEGITLNLLDNE